MGIKNKTYCIETSYPKGECFGQIPSDNEHLELKKMSCYISAGNSQKYLFPYLINKPVGEVIEFLKKYEISYDVYYKDQKIVPPYKQEFIVINQKPLAGTFVQPNNQLYVQLQVA
jgi:beta-lactam-binding protein with PASTA domain